MWNLYRGEKFLEPLCFSNGKSQKDVVNEVLSAINNGHNVIFIHGVCGTGKSAIALNVARNLGKASVVVPGKNLQNQYKKDYEKDKYILKENNEKMKISVITGRNNHRCRFLEENNVPVIKKEVNSKLHDIFEKIRQKGRDLSADNNSIPCKIKIKEKNWLKIQSYLRKNKNINSSNFKSVANVKRASVAGACPYWCPVILDEYELKGFDDKKKYMGLNNKKFVFYQGKKGCKFYEQFNSFINSDVIVFNSLKYKLESALDRKPQTQVEIIDECDEFLDSFSNKSVLNIDRLLNSISLFITQDENAKKIIKEINEIIKHMRNNPKISDSIYSDKIFHLKETGIYDLFKIFLNSSSVFKDADEENYIFEVEEIAKMFEEFFDETYVSFSKEDGSLIASIVTTNLAKKFKEMVDKNKIIILMSGTLHNESVLKNIFGLESFKVIEAETKQQGDIIVKRTGFEMDCRYSNNVSRQNYLNALSKCIDCAKKPVLVHVNAFNDLPTQQEIEEYNLSNLIGREKLREMQINDKEGYLVDEFKKAKVDVLFSTRCSRGIDFPGEECNSIVFTKYPNPNVRDVFWRILHNTRPQYYWDFYKDKAKRELLQKIYRGLRFRGDFIYLLSPDSRVLEVFER
jgi:Rad3-related DNA helicase